MKFWTDYVWPQEGEDPCGESLLLQQVRLGKKSAVLALIGREEGDGTPMGEWKDWFQREGVFLCEKPELESLKQRNSG